MLRSRIQTVIGWLHSSLIFAILAPIFYVLTLDKELYHLGRVYATSFMIALPIALTDFIVHKSRSLILYLIRAVFVSAASVGAALAAGNRLIENNMAMGAVVFMAVETVYVVIERLLIRIHEKGESERKEKNPDWHPRDSVLLRPGIFGFVFFVFAYLVGLVFSNAVLCNLALGSAVLYLPLEVLDQYLVKTEEYLSLNRRVCNLPVRRLYGISASACALFMLLLLAAGMMAALAAGRREYMDWSTGAENVGRADVILEMDGERLPLEGDSFQPEMFEMGEPAEPPVWVEPLSYLLALLAFLVVLWLCIMGIAHICKVFRETYDANGDVVEEIEELSEQMERIKPKRRQRGSLSRREEIRRRYRREIRKRRKEKPAPCESPYEIEQNAGIAETEEGKQLHLLYEEARYGLPKPEDMSL